MNSLRTFKSWIFSFLAFSFLLLLIIFFRLFIFDLVYISSCSMTPCLEHGDIIMVSKLCYGPRTVKFHKLMKERKLEYQWYKGISKPKKGDVIIFNWPDYPSLTDGNSDFYSDYIVKRCFAIANDTVVIIKRRKEENEGMKKNRRNVKTKNEELKIIKEKSYDNEEKPLLFPYDGMLSWTIDHYGPLWVPGKSKTIKLTSVSANHYKGMLLFEGNAIEIRNDSVFLKGKYTSEYTFKENYYFMLGDNFYGSKDSRYWGFVPEKSIVGKAVFVLFSWDPDAKWFRKFRWDRFLKRIE
ncbi:MAG: signal peptidase I [Bacteroidales bacterium]|nr:signal peptidase I [Bacteroidales bacterium]